MTLTTAFLFIAGTAIGSFLNVLALRYKEDGRLLFTHSNGGRSHCKQCQKTLSWYELIPILSYLIQCGRCLSCKTLLTLQYPVIELAAGVLTALLPTILSAQMKVDFLGQGGISTASTWAIIALWLIITYTLLVIASIDMRLSIIPNQANALLFISGLGLLTIYAIEQVPMLNMSGSYGLFLGFLEHPWYASLLGGLFSLVLFGGIVLLTKERGMGMGDVKLAIPLGIIVGWPTVFLMTVISFSIGAIVGLAMIARKKTTLKGMLPFGPFLVLGFFATVFFGETILRWYFSIL